MRHKFIFLCGALLSSILLTVKAESLILNKGDRIAIVGNTLADRMQHSGHLETLVHSRFPKHELVFRNLGFSGDEVAFRLRSEGFGSPDEWLKLVKADVIFAFFGFNESFKSQGGLDQFRKELDEFLKKTLEQNYSGKGNPRIVLFSPIAQEKHPDPNFASPEANNHNIKIYAQAMAEAAKARGIQFVDLYSLSESAYAQAKEPLTFNGIHLRDAGYEALAPSMFESIFGEEPPPAGTPAFEKLRAAVNEKNALWFSRYRTVDGYNVYGGRSHLEFNGVKNRDTMQREMQRRDAMTENRDRRVWAVSQGGDLQIQDDNLPPRIEVKSNKPGPNPDGTHRFLSGEEAIQKMKLAKGCQVNLFASEEQFPQLVNPVQMAFDVQGRLWVAAWPNYPERTPESKKGDSLLVFEDSDGDGKADKCTPFIEDLNCPTGFQFYKDGVILVQAPDVWFLRDTDGDGRADWKERILNGIDSADSHHTANALALDPGGAIYLSDGVFHRTQVETATGPVRNNDAAIFRFEPRASKFEVYIAYGFANPHGRVFDYWGNDLVTDATGNNTYFGPAISGRIDYPAKHPSLRQFWERPSRPCPGTGILTSRHFPEEFQGNFLNCNVIGFLGIFRVKVKEEGSGLWGETLEHLVQSEDPNFRPTAVGVAPDGAIYFLDWHNPIIGHMQHHIRDPNRDHAHGRVYRITYAGRPLLKPAKIKGAPIEALLDWLKVEENDLRTLAKIELGTRDSQEVLTAAKKWAAQFDSAKVDHQHHLMEALWLHQWHNVVNESLLRQMLQSPEPRARAAAVRVLCYWRNRIPNPLALLRTAANDESPRVRLEAVRAASFFQNREALEVAYEILKYDTDYYLDYVFNETKRVLQRSPNDIVLPNHPKALARIVPQLSDQELLNAPECEPVWLERIERKTMNLNTRIAALEELSKAHQTDRVSELIALLRRFDAKKQAGVPVADLGMILAANLPADLEKARPALLDMSHSARIPAVRRAAYAGLVAADGKPDAVWNSTAGNEKARAILLDSIILHTDPEFRGQYQPLLIAALKEQTTPAPIRGAVLRALPLLGADHAAANYDILATHVREGHELTAAARSLLQLPRDLLAKTDAAPVVEAILAWAKSIPAAERTGQEYVETVQAGLEIASFLPSRESAALRKQLVSLGVRTFVINAVREQMRYDITRLVVEAGKPFEIIFENGDMMPHNLVVVQPAAREEVGLQAQSMQPDPDRDGRVYVPRNRKILAASKLLEPGQKETLKLTAPAKEGAYEYVCTYPEHWKVMFGQLLVVKSLDDFLQASAANPLSSPAATHEHH